LGLVSLSGTVVAPRPHRAWRGCNRVPAVKNVGEPCAGEPHARFEVAAGGIWRSVGDAARALAPPADPPQTLFADASGNETATGCRGRLCVLVVGVRGCAGRRRGVCQGVWTV